MALRCIFALAFVAGTSASFIPNAHVYQSAPVAIAGAHNVVVKSGEYNYYPQYKYAYDVEDKLTGDSKSHVEERNGDVVHGEYSLIDADGYKRTVKYTADHNGYNAVVERKPLVPTTAHYPAPTIAKAPNYYRAPNVVSSYDVPIYLEPLKSPYFGALNHNPPKPNMEASIHSYHR